MIQSHAARVRPAEARHGDGRGIGDGILATVGHTPLVRLTRLWPDSRITTYAKLEQANPGGSAKDRPALQMLLDGLRSGAIRPGSTVVESSSGNMGVALAQACTSLGLRFICVVDPKTTTSHIKLLKAFGAAIDRVEEADAVTGEYLPVRIQRVRDIVASTADCYWPNQYANPANPEAHYGGTMAEIVSALGRRIDFLFCATSTCGTLAGCSRYVRDRGLDVRVVAVDAVGSVLFGGRAQRRLVPGHGASIRPPLRDGLEIDRCLHVTDWDCVVGCRRLVRREAILAGGSTGGVVMAADRMRPEMPDDAVCVLIFHDRGERYLDTIYSDDWVIEHFSRLPDAADGGLGG